MKIVNLSKIAFIKNLEKAYTEGVYADTPANRKLGRVGMSYAQYAQKVSGESENQKKQESENQEKSNIENSVKYIESFDDYYHKFKSGTPDPKDAWDRALYSKYKSTKDFIEGKLEIPKNDQGFVFNSENAKNPKYNSPVKGEKNDHAFFYMPSRDLGLWKLNDEFNKEGTKLIPNILKRTRKNSFFADGTNFLQNMHNAKQKKMKSLEDLEINGKKITPEQVKDLKRALFDVGRYTAYGDSAQVGNWGPRTFLFNKAEVNMSDGGKIVKEMNSYNNQIMNYYNYAII